jgi:multiple sugar transport system permease protein
MADVATLAGRVRRTPSVATRGSLRRWFGRKSSVGFLMCLPLIVLVATLVIYPALYAIYLSMLNKKMTQFVGLSNYAFLLAVVHARVFAICSSA